MNINEFRDGIFALRTRRFGNVAEIMIEKIYRLENSNKLNYDRFDAVENKKIEIKFSTVMKENEERINSSNVIEQCLKANIANRAMKFEDISQYKFDCNIQQIKCNEFDILYYGLFFADAILIFKISSNDILKLDNYSNKQHRNNEGEGQFHINNDNLQFHIDNFLIKQMTYDNLYKIFLEN